MKVPWSYGEGRAAHLPGALIDTYGDRPVPDTSRGTHSLGAGTHFSIGSLAGRECEGRCARALRPGAAMCNAVVVSTKVDARGAARIGSAT